MKRTPKNVLRILKLSGRHWLNERQLTKLRSERLLPKLEPGVKEGTNIPENAWTQPDIVKHAAMLHDLLTEWSHRHELLYLPLWLLGFDVPFEPVRALFLTRAERNLKELTQGETDPDELGDLISSFVYQSLKQRKNDPRPGNIFKQYGSEYSERVLSFMLNIFANSTYEINGQTLMLLLESAPKTRSTKQDELDGALALMQEPDPVYLNIAKVVQEVVSMSKMRDVMATAWEKEWEEAREDFQALASQVYAIFNVSMSLSGQTLTLPQWLKFNALVKTALFSFPVLLSMRQKGYGHWIDLYVCTFVKGSSKKEQHVVSRRRITSLESTELSHASSHYMFGRALAPLYSTVSGAALEAPISVLRNRTAGADAL